MIGALIGDIAGSRFEWHNIKSKEFELFTPECRLTDDSIMSLAVAMALMESGSDLKVLSDNAVKAMQSLGQKYPFAGYGGRFARWLGSDDPKPYGSYGNGAGMRVGPCGFAASSLTQAVEFADAVTRVTHDHPEGMKGAEAIASAVYLAREGNSKEEIRKHIEDNYYRIDFTLDQIRDDYKYDISCQGSVPQALEAFFESEDLEDAVRNAISIGGDSDTIAAMTGAVAEAFYGVPGRLAEEVIDYLMADQLDILLEFEKRFPSKSTVRSARRTMEVWEIMERYLANR